MTIIELVDLQLSTQLLEAMYKSTDSQIKFLTSLNPLEEKLGFPPYEPKELIGWRNKLSAAISIRKSFEKPEREYANLN